MHGKSIKKMNLEDCIFKLLSLFNIDLNHPDFIDTPRRVIGVYEELFEGLTRQGDIKKMFASKFPSQNDNMIIIPVHTHGICPHHLLPVAYDIKIGYIPDEFVLGFSKFSRITEILSHRPVLQETLTCDIGEAIQSNLKCHGTGVSVSGHHLCMEIRGPKQNVVVRTSHLTGLFMEDQKVREEFYLLIR